MAFLRFLMFLSLTVWVGGIIFLSFVEAPTAFHALPSRHLAGTVVGHSLGVLHWMGLFSGIVFLGSSMLLSSLTTGTAKPLAVRHVLIVLMLLLTAISQFGIAPKMAALRTQFGDIDAVPPTDPARIQFGALHMWSFRLEVAVLAMGLGALFCTARQIP
jgi:Domain of unknown function (DUF4149)